MRPLLWIFALLFPLASLAATQLPSGVYDGTMIAINPATQKLTGYIHMETGNHFSCIHYFSGTLQNNKAIITRYFPDDIGTPSFDARPGTVILTSPTSLELRPGETLESSNACGPRDETSTDENPTYSLLQDAPHPAWRSIAVIRSEKAHFYKQPDAATPEKAYLVKGDGVGVIEDHGDWLQVEYATTKKPITGWMRKQDFYRLR